MFEVGFGVVFFPLPLLLPFAPAQPFGGPPAGGAEPAAPVSPAERSWHGSARLGSAWLGSARFGLAQSCSGYCAA